MARSTKTPALRQTSATLPLRPDGGLRVAVVADTHSHPHPDAARLITAEAPDAILHAGDIGDLAVLDQLGAIAPLFAIRGNIDTHAPDLPDIIDLHLESGGHRVFDLQLQHIAVYGPKLRADAAKRARAAGARMVVCGHSHVPFIGRDKGLLIFNPGSIGPRRFQLPIVFGMLEIEGGELHLRHIDCETGARWAP